MKYIRVNYNRELDLNSLHSFSEPQSDILKNLWDRFVDSGGKGFVDENELLCCLEDDFMMFIKESFPNIDESTINDDIWLDEDGKQIFVPSDLLQPNEE